MEGTNVLKASVVCESDLDPSFLSSFFDFFLIYSNVSCDVIVILQNSKQAARPGLQ